MNWRIRIAAAATGLLILSILIVIGLTLNLGSAGPAGPGHQNILSLSPDNQLAQCGGSPVVVEIFLDDLAVGDPTSQAPSGGIVGFQFLLRYNPGVLKIDDASQDIEINQGLSLEDPDGDGLVRSFVLVTDIDGDAGDALVLGIGLPPSGKNFEEGPDPVTRGSPLLLATIKFRPVGRGTTQLLLRDPAGTRHPAFEEPQVLDPVGRPYEPLIVNEATVTVDGGDCPVAPPLPERPTPTPRPLIDESTLYPPIEPIAAPAAIAPVRAADAGRTDCQAGRAAHRDQGGEFSICYPIDWVATLGPPEAYFGASLTLVSPVSSTTDRQDSLRIHVYWSEYGSDACEAVEGLWKDIVEAPLRISGNPVISCRGDMTGFGELPDGLNAQAIGTYVEIPSRDGNGVVVFFISELIFDGAKSSHSVVLEEILDEFQLE